MLAAVGLGAALWSGPHGASASTQRCQAAPHAGVNFEGCNLAGRDFAGANLTGADLHGADLQNADLRGALLDGANLHRADIEGALMYGATMDDVISGSLRGIPILPLNWNMVNGYLVGPGANLTGAQFTDANLFDADLANARLTGADLTSAISGSVTGTPILPRAWRLINGYLVGPDANLNGAALIGADLSHVDLSGAQMIGTQLAHANLAGADLIGTQLANADLTSANLTEADMAGANFNGALTAHAITDSSTICPSGGYGPCNASWRFLKGLAA
jgi:uncharacterized protein YjbI with pentapeptide repeats